MAKFFKILPIIIALLYAGYKYVDTYVLPSLFIFDPKVLGQIVTDAVATSGDNSTILFRTINSALRKEYGDHVNELNFDDWMFNNAGGAMGSMFIQHASITEYLIFFGTAIGTEGHTGVHTANDYFYILKGEQWVHELGNPDPVVYGPGSVHVLERGTSQQYSMPTTCWALELAQGWIPPMLPFGFADALSSTLDIETIYRTVYFTGKAMIESLLRGKV
ncbi:ERG2/sigma1 receptor-like protein [Lipomyces japonicus]|uniref:ERG2/sigma1 receptor-like protein n=1 Tax=Lipomyces japonicus TaxID=56871 RepID=UPI0034CF2E4A